MQMQAVSRAEGIALLENEGVQDQGACEECTHDQSKQPGNVPLAHVYPTALYVKPSAVTWRQTPPGGT
jgi:hypothetical protein